MSHTLNFEHCHLATGNNIRADNIALLLPENTLTEHYAALWQVAFADNQCWQESLHLDRLGIPGVNGEADYPPGVCLWRITELSAFCRDVVAFWLLRRKTHGVQLAALLTDETPCCRATLLDDPNAGADWRDEASITASFDKNIWSALRVVLADPAQEYRSEALAAFLVCDGRQYAADDEASIRYIGSAINILTFEQYRNKAQAPFAIADISRSLRHMASLFAIATADRDRALAHLEQPRNRGIICQPMAHMPQEGEHVVDLVLQLRFEDAPDGILSAETVSSMEKIDA